MNNRLLGNDFDRWGRWATVVEVFILHLSSHRTWHRAKSADGGGAALDVLAG